MVDVENDPLAHDLSVTEVIVGFCQRILRGEWRVMGLAPVCTSFSHSLRPAVRHRLHPWGLPPELLPARLKKMTGVEYLRTANGVVVGALSLVRAAVAASLEFWVEQPADGMPSHMPDGTPNRFYHHRSANTAHLFRMVEWLEAVQSTGGVYILLLQCPFGAPSPKPTVVFATPGLAPYLQQLARAECECVSHLRLRGRDSQGRALTRVSQAYPGPINGHLAYAMDEATPVVAVPPRHEYLDTGRAGADEDDGSEDDGPPSLVSASISSGDDSESDGEPGESSHACHPAAAPRPAPGGEMRYGPALDPRVRAAFEAARLAPPRHASYRRLDAASDAELRATPYSSIAPRVRSRTTRTRVAGQPHCDAPDATAGAAYAGRPPGRIHLRQLFLSAATYRAVLEWIVAAESACCELAAGKRVRGPPTLIVSQLELVEWARGIIWDTRDAAHCTPCEPSSAATGADEYPGPQIDRAIFREWAEELGVADEEIIAQVGHGGVESRARPTLDMVLAFHHKGILEDFASADAVVQADIEQGFVSEGYMHPTFVPCKLGPRNVAWQERSRLVADDAAAGTSAAGAPPAAPCATPPGARRVEYYMKPRITFDLSFGVALDAADIPAGASKRERYKVPPVNVCVPDDAADIEVPTIHALATNSAIVGSLAADEPDVDAESASADISNAYSYLRQQRLDWWLQGFIWTGGVRNSRRVVFGGKFGPQGFTAALEVPKAKIAQRIEVIERDQPPPPSVLRAVAARCRLQEIGELPPEPVQARAWSLEWYLDDATLAALNDYINTPEWLRGVETGHEESTRSNGGTPSRPGSRILVYLKVIIKTLEELGFAISISKTQAGDLIIPIGFRLRPRARRVDVPPVKQATLLEAATTMRDAVVRGERLPLRSTEQFVGRLSNVSQVEPPLLEWLHAGYAVVCVRTRNRRLRPKFIKLRADGRRQVELLSLLDLAVALLEANEGVAAGHRAPPRTSDAGVLTVLTDASLAPEAGDDGVGGFAFHADAPDAIFIFSVAWPPDVRAALLNGGQPVASRTVGPATALPWAETFGSVALAALVHERVPVVAVVAVGDCDPAAAAINAGSSSSPQVRSLLREARRLTNKWNAVTIPREWHTDADLLSHPSELEEVLARARSQFSTVTLLDAEGPVMERAWATARAAIALPMARAEQVARGRGELITVCKARHAPPGFTQVDVRRPGPLGNPFAMTRAGRASESWRHAVCGAFRVALAAAVGGVEADLAVIAADFGLPPEAVATPYADRTWRAYAADVCDALAELDARLCAGERLALACVCHPRECHAHSLLDVLTSELCLPCQA